MKRIILVCFSALLLSAKLLAQDTSQFNHIKLKNQTDYRLADSTVSRVAAYLLSTPVDHDTAVRLRSAEFLMKWMDGTSDYTFTLDQSSTKYFIDDINLMAVYMGALCKAALQYPPGAESKKITLSAIRLLLNYANDAGNHVQRTDQFNELSKANDRGELETFLNL